jgi:hypothetical protein
MFRWSNSRAKSRPRIQSISPLFVKGYEDLGVASNFHWQPKCQNTRRWVEIHDSVDVASTFGHGAFWLAKASPSIDHTAQNCWRKSAIPATLRYTWASPKTRRARRFVEHKAFRALGLIPDRRSNARAPNSFRAPIPGYNSFAFYNIPRLNPQVSLFSITFQPRSQVFRSGPLFS